MTRYRHLLLGSVLLLGACAVGPDYRRPAVTTPDGWRLDAAEARQSANIKWWEQFDDPVLGQLIAEALYENKDVRIATARVEEFIGRLRTTRSGLFPQFGYGADAARQRSSEVGPTPLPAGADPAYDAYSAVINAGWEIDLWGKLRRASEAARADLLASEDARRAVILTLVATVANAYIVLRGFDEQLDIATRTRESRSQAVTLFEKRYRGGVVSELELKQVISEYEQAAAAVPVAESNVAQAENLLSVLLGRNPGPVPRGKGIFEFSLPPVPAALPSSLLEQRPDIQQAEQALIAANARIGVARARYFPAISLTGFFGSASADLSDLFTSPARIWNYGGIISGPIFTAGAISGEVQTATAQQQQALLAYERAIQNAFREVEDALISHAKFREQLTAQQRRVKALEDYARLARLRYDNGYTSYLEVLDSERSLFNAELSLSQNQGRVFTALINIYKSIGGGWVAQAEQMTGATTDGPGVKGEPATDQ